MSFVGVREQPPGATLFTPPEPQVEPQLRKLCPNYFVKHNWTINTTPAATWIPVGGRLQPPASRPQVEEAEWLPKYCIIARTYAGQSPASNMFSIDRFVASILMQTLPQWHLIILDTDTSKSYSYLYQNLSEWVNANEPFRIRVANVTNFSQQFPAPPSMPEGDTKAAQSKSLLHTNVYWLSDHVISSLCPPSAQSFLATNGDNWYHPRFLEEVDNRLKQARLNGYSIDILGVDFFSRYATYIWGMPKPERTCAALEEYSPCVCNGVVPLRSDLGSMMFNLTRWRQEQHSFFNLSTNCVWGRQNGTAAQSIYLPLLYEFLTDLLLQPMPVLLMDYVRVTTGRLTDWGSASSRTPLILTSAVSMAAKRCMLRSARRSKSSNACCPSRQRRLSCKKRYPVLVLEVPGRYAIKPNDLNHSRTRTHLNSRTPPLSLGRAALEV